MSTFPWIGGTKDASSGYWIWKTSNRPIANPFWGSRQPSGDGECIQIRGQRQWNDAGCDRSFPYICEFV